MKTALILLVCFVGCSVHARSEHYSDLYDHIDIDFILGNQRIANQYIACLMEKGPCTADGRSFKRILPEALVTNCVKCTDRQRQIARKVCNYMRKEQPDTWTSLVDKYDPQKEHIDEFLTFLDEIESGTSE